MRRRFSRMLLSLILILSGGWGVAAPKIDLDPGIGGRMDVATCPGALSADKASDPSASGCDCCKSGLSCDTEDMAGCLGHCAHASFFALPSLHGSAPATPQGPSYAPSASDPARSIFAPATPPPQHV